MSTSHPLPCQVGLRFYAELNDFLRRDQQGQRLLRKFLLPLAVKDAIESFGVPHTEVDLILINGESADFYAKLHNGDEVSVFPVFESLDIGSVQKVRPEPLRHIAFAVDVNMGRLAFLLRLMGFDALYRNDFADAELADLAVAEKRILLTRDRGLLKRRQLTHAWFVRATKPEEQLLAVLRRFNLEQQLQPFTRCLRCNGEVIPVAKTVVLDSLPPRVCDNYELFCRCQNCKRVYWQGTHYQHMQKFVRTIHALLASG